VSRLSASGAPRGWAARSQQGRDRNISLANGDETARRIGVVLDVQDKDMRGLACSNWVLCEPAIGLGPGHFLPSLIHQTHPLQQPRGLGILHRLILCAGICYGRDLYPRILLPPDLCSGMSLGPDICPRILRRPDLSVLLHGPDLWSGILHNPCWGISIGLCPLGRPSLEFLEQGVG